MTVPLPSLFQRRTLTPDGIRINTLIGGKAGGSPVLLLHGYPQTHVMWHHVAPALAEHHTVVLTDLRGYGDSGKPAGGARHEGYAKRTMARDQMIVMRELGFDEFAVAGHDRGGRVAHRMALDYPRAITKIAVLDIVPTRHAFHHANREFGLGYWHWFFLAQPEPLPEQLLGADPEGWIRGRLSMLRRGGHPFDGKALDEYVRCFRDPAAIHASCEDYRAAATIDLNDDDASAARGEKVTAPLLALWGEHGFVGRHYRDVLAIWQQYAVKVDGCPLPCGHFLPEEVPAETTTALQDFFRERNLARTSPPDSNPLAFLQSRRWPSPVVLTMRTTPLRWLLRLTGAGLLIATAAMHLDLYLTGFRTIPTIGPLFLFQVIAGFALGLAILAAPFTPVTRRPAVDASIAAVGAGYAIATLGGYLLSLWVGLFGFHEIRSTAGTVAGILEIAAFGVLLGLAVLVYDPQRAGRPGDPAPARPARLPALAAAAISFLTVVAAVVFGVSVATASSGQAVPATAGGTVMLRTATIGGVSVLTNSSGRTLYSFAPDTSSSSACYGTCAAYWPPVIGNPVAGQGVTVSKIATIARTDGTIQVTYAGHPLYTYVGDTAPGQASGNDINLNGGFWHEVPAAG
ncbi:MAG: alpha/beta fold hydrolase [Trebonia sp.]